MDDDAIRRQFHEAAGTYGGWHQRYAERLVALTPIALGDRVLDMGSGTGAVARAALRRVGPSGAVVGIDIAEAIVDDLAAPHKVLYAVGRRPLEERPVLVVKPTKPAVWKKAGLARSSAGRRARPPA